MSERRPPCCRRHTDGAPEWLARGGGQVPADIDEAVRLAPAALRRPPAVTINEVNGFQRPVPVWDGRREWQGAVLPAEVAAEEAR